MLRRARDLHGAASSGRSPPRRGEVALWRELADTLMHAGRYDAALAAIARGRAAAGAQPALRRARGGLPGRAGRDRGGRPRCSPRSAPIEHVTMAARYVRHLLRAGRPAEAAAFAETWLDRRPEPI